MHKKSALRFSDDMHHADYLPWCDRQSQSEESRRYYEQERLIGWVMEKISASMEENNLTKADLAAKLNCSRSHITQLLSGSRNATLRSIADLAWACGSRFDPRLEPLRYGQFISTPVTHNSNVRMIEFGDTGRISSRVSGAIDDDGYINFDECVVR